MIFVHNGDFVDVVPVSVIEKIRAEIEKIEPLDYPCDKREPEHIRDMALEIIDKYAEQAEIQADYDRQKASGMTDEEWEYGKAEQSGWEEMTVPCENCGHDMTFKIATIGEPCEDCKYKSMAEQEPTSPCDLCRFNMDEFCGYLGECPAMAKGGE